MVGVLSGLGKKGDIFHWCLPDGKFFDNPLLVSLCAANFGTRNLGDAESRRAREIDGGRECRGYENGGWNNIRTEHYHAFTRALPRTSMTDQSRDPGSTASTAAGQAGARRKSRRGNASGKLATLLRRCEGSRRQEYKREDPTSEPRFKGPSTSKLSFLDFVCNVKKHLLLRNLCKSKKSVSFFRPFVLLFLSSFFVRSKISSLLFFRDALCPLLRHVSRSK